MASACDGARRKMQKFEYFKWPVLVMALEGKLHF